MKKSISFTSEQFRVLLELTYLGEYMANGHKTSDRIEKFDELLKHLISLADQFKLENVSLPEDPQYPTAQFEEELYKYISEYDNDTFWTELTDRLSLKLLTEHYTLEEVEAMTRDEFFLNSCKIEEKVSHALQTHGLNAFHHSIDLNT